MNKLEIPKRFKLFGKTIEVKQSNSLSSERDLVGAGNLKVHEIQLQTNCDGYKIKDEEMVITFWHEVVHFIMYDLEFKLEDGTYAHRNEQFCNLLSLCLQQVLSTMEYEE